MDPSPETSPRSGNPSPIHQHLEILEQAERMVYKKVDRGPDLNAYIFLPENHQVTDDRPGFLFFYGSGWDHGAITQFAPQALYFANRGAICILIEYRLASTHQAHPSAATQDARSAVRWLRFYADRIGVDPQRIVAIGASAGAHIAAAAVMNLDTPDDDTDPPLSGQPDALVLFSPILDVVKGGYAADRFANANELKQAQLSRYLRKELPPTLIFHGTRDRMVPFDSVEKFCRKSKRRKNHCELVDLEGRENRYFNLNVDPATYEYCISRADRFLVEQGFLPEDPAGDGGEIRLESWR